jgi:hypothetical protein
MATATLTMEAERAIRAAIRDDAGFGTWTKAQTHEDNSLLSVQIRVTNARAVCGSVGRRVELRFVENHGAQIRVRGEWCAVESLDRRGELYDSAADAAERMLSR